jgi:hypothetical protein
MIPCWLLLPLFARRFLRRYELKAADLGQQEPDECVAGTPATLRRQAAPADQEGCGGLTGVTPLMLYRAWIVDTARKFNSPVGP